MGTITIIGLIVGIALWLALRPRKAPPPQSQISGEAPSARPSITITATISTSEEVADVDSTYHDVYWFPTEGNPRRLQAKLHLDYQKTDGQRVSRDFDLVSFDRGDEGYRLEGYCHLRGAHRSLSSKAVLSAVDRDTGEVISDLRSYLEDKYRATPEGELSAFWGMHWRELHILLYAAGADGAMRAPERAVIASYCTTLDVGKEFRTIEWDAALKSSVRPSKSEFHSAARELLEKDVPLQPIYEAVIAIVGTQKEVHSEEERVLSYLARTWKGRISAK
jgi:hypothetical protein